MVDEPKREAATEFKPSAIGPTPSSRESEPRLPVLRFGLRQMFWFLTVVSIVLAGLFAAPTPGVAPLAMLLAVLVVAFHVAGTALGSRLRAHADEHVAWTAAEAQVKPPVLRRVPLGPRSSWHRCERSMPWRWWIVGTGALTGGTAGMAVFLLADTMAPSPIGVAFGACSMAVVGGWGAFLAGSFWVMLRRGWREAVDQQRKDELAHNRTEN